MNPSAATAPDDDDGRRPHPHLRGPLGGRGQRRVGDPLTLERTVLDDRDRQVGVGARRHGGPADLPQRGDRHEQHHRRPLHQRGEGRGLGPGVARRHEHRRRDPSLGQRDAGQHRYGERRADAGHHRDVDPRDPTGVQLLAPSPEDEGVATLQPHHRLAQQRPLHEQPVDLDLGHRVVRRGLAHLDDLDVRRQPLEQPGGPQPVGHDDVGGRKRLEPRQGDQAGVPGPTADQHHAPAARPATTQVGLPRRQVQREGVAHGGGPAGVRVGIRGDSDDETVVPGRRHRSGRAGRATHAPGTPLLAPAGHLGVHRGVRGRGHDQPRGIHVLVAHPSLQQLDPPTGRRGGQLARGIRRGRVDEHDVRALGRQPARSPRADRTGPGHEDPASREVEADEGGHDRVSRRGRGSARAPP